VSAVKHLFIINPRAGKSDRTEKLVPLIREAMSGRSQTYDIQVTQYAGHARALVQSLRGGEQTRVYICGGDGTLNEAVNGAAGAENLSVAHYPCGSGNDFIRIFGDTALFTDFGRLIEGTAYTVDLLACNGEKAINLCSVGFDARIAAMVPELKRLPLLPGSGAYSLSILINLMRGISADYRIDIDGQSFNGRYVMAVACNGGYYGGGYHPMPEARLDDGMIDFLLVRSMSRLRIAKIIGQYKQGLHGRFPEEILWVRGRKMELSCAGPDAVNYDGEVVSAAAASISLAKERLGFIVPEGANLAGAFTKNAEKQRKSEIYV